MSKMKKNVHVNPVILFRRKMIAAALVFLVLVLCVFYLVQQVNDKVVAVSYPVCGLTQQEIVEKFEDVSYDQMYQIKDYHYYGETLNFYSEPYVLGEKDFFAGKTVMLSNVCNPDQEYVFMLDNTIDGQIPVEILPEGLYEVYLMIDLSLYRAYSETVVFDSFNTIRREGVSKKVELIADKNIFDDKNSIDVLDNNYFYISVEEDEVSEEIYDIVIDPAHSSYDRGTIAEYGGEAFGLVEADLNYNLALQLEKELENYGLNVLVLREDENEVVSTYGIDGRLHRAYQSKAKYYIEIQMNYASSSKYRGLQVAHSSYTSPRLASALLSELLASTDLVSTGNKSTGSISGVVASGRSGVYDGKMTIRESGGKALGAGTFSDQSIVGNASFALNEVHGMQSIIIEYIYLSNEEDVNLFMENYHEYAKVTADAFVDYLRVNE